MSKLTTKERNALPDSDFAGPNRTYPVEDKAHAANAKARASQHAGPKLKARIDAKADKKFGKKSPKPKTAEYKRHWSQTKTETKKGGSK